MLHHDGPATNWASRAEPGHHIGIAGPRGSFVVPLSFNWHLLIGDETALPAISRRLEELPENTRAIAIIKTVSDDAKIDLHAKCAIQTHWVTDDSYAADGRDALEATVRKLTLPEGEGYVWAAGEYSDIKALRHYLVSEAGVDKTRLRAASYWRKSVPDSHEQFE